MRAWLSVCLVAQTMLAMDTSILNTAARTLTDPVRGVGASTAQVQWSISGYTVALAAALFTGGALVDRWGPKRALLVGLGAFTVCSAVTAVSADGTQLVLGRIAMGLAAALLAPSTLAIVLALAPAEKRTMAISVWATAPAIGMALGPPVAGVLLERFGWGSVLLINVPIGVVCFFTALAIVPATTPPRKATLDLPGLLLSFAAMTCLVGGFIELGKSTLTATVSLVSGVVFAALFVVVELRRRSPGVALRLFAGRRFAGSQLTILCAYFAVVGQLYFAQLYLQGVLGVTPMVAGLLVLPTAIGIVVGNFSAPRLAARHGAALIIRCGSLVCVLTYLSYLTFTEHTPLIVFVIIIFVQGMAMGWLTVPATTEALRDVDPTRTGSASAITNATRSFGAAAGVAITASVLAAGYPLRLADAVDVPAFLTAMHGAVWVVVVVALVPVFLVPLISRSRRRTPERSMTTP